jgi:hypothetical protein
MPLKTQTVDRLLLSKSLLERIGFRPTAVHDRHTVAANILAAHDAAELAIAAICDELGCSPQQGKSYLMDYFEPLKQAEHPDKEVHAKDYFRNLNEARSLLKHRGLFPDPRQWARVGEITFQHIAKWCSDYLNESFGELDASALLVDPQVREMYEEAKRSSAQQDFKTALEKLALALSKVFGDNAALRGFEAGWAKPEDAIRLAGFGVHGNDYLALQQFLPHVRRWGEQANVPRWKQSEFGHPGNWEEQNIEFCLRTFVDVAVQIQGAQWVPGPVKRDIIYDQQIEALRDGVEVWHMVPEQQEGQRMSGYGFLLGGPLKREVIRTLKRGETLRARVSVSSESFLSELMHSVGARAESTKVLNVAGLEEPKFFGSVLASEVRVTCVPSDDDFVRQYYPWLPTIDWEPE